MTNTASVNSHSLADSVEKALEHTQQVVEELKGAADELGVVHAVLDKKLAETPDSDVVAAVARTQQLEERIIDSVETLELANELLTREAGRKSAT